MQWDPQSANQIGLCLPPASCFLKSKLLTSVPFNENISRTQIIPSSPLPALTEYEIVDTEHLEGLLLSKAALLKRCRNDAKNRVPYLSKLGNTGVKRFVLLWNFSNPFTCPYASGIFQDWDMVWHVSQVYLTTKVAFFKSISQSHCSTGHTWGDPQQTCFKPLPQPREWKVWLSCHLSCMQYATGRGNLVA